jgi:hypothetical protein
MSDEELLENESGLEINGDDDSLSIYPNAEVRVEKVQYSVLHLKRLCENRKELILNPDFQRKDVWKGKQRAESIVVKMKSLADIMQFLGHKKIDVLKMDIEGLEYEIIESIVNSDIKIVQILIENINHHRHIQQLIPHCRMLGIGKQSVIIFLCDDLPVKNQSVREMKFL